MNRISGLIFAKYKNTIYVNSKYTGIDLAILLIDGVKLHGFVGDRAMYITLDDMRAWYQKEIQVCTAKEKPEFQDMLTHIVKAERRFQEEDNITWY